MLIIFGLFLSFFILEIGLRIGGFVFLYLQEQLNRVSITHEGTYNILCIGESTTALGGKDSYPVQLEQILNQHNIGIRFSVINRGIPGATSLDIMAALGDNLRKYKPDMVIAMMGAGDPGGIVPYEAIITPKITLFSSFRIYKMVRLIKLQIVAKLKEVGFYKPKENEGKHKTQIGVSNNRLSIRGDISADSIEFEKEVNGTVKINSQPYFELAESYRKRGDFARAEKIFKKCLKLDPTNYKAYIRLGLSYHEQGKYFHSIESYKKAIELNPLTCEAHLILGCAYRSQGKYFEAEEVFKKGIEIYPRDNNEIYNCLAECYRSSGKLVQAEEIFKKLIKINPQNDKAYSGLISLYEEMEKYKLAQEYYKKLNKLKLGYYNPITRYNYRTLKKILDKQRIKLVCVQYPMRSIEPLKRLLKDEKDIIFIDNEYTFRKVLKKEDYKEYFSDMFGGDFGHCTSKGNKLLAKNVANIILKEIFNR